MRKKNLAIFLAALFTLVVVFLFSQTAIGQIVVPNSTGLPDPGDAPGYAGSGPVIAVIFYFLNWILSVFMLLAVIAFVITGVQYLMAAGDQSRAETAKRNFMYSMIAVAIVGAGLIIIRTINWILS